MSPDSFSYKLREPNKETANCSDACKNTLDVETPLRNDCQSQHVRLFQNFQENPEMTLGANF